MVLLGRCLGATEFSVTPIAGSTGAHEFRSLLRATGLYRLFAPRPVEEVSAFVFENDRVRPLSYSLRSESRGETDDFNIVFDWEQRIATVTAVNLEVHTELVRGVLDRGALQVTLMLRGNGDHPENYTLNSDRMGRMSQRRSWREDTRPQETIGERFRLKLPAHADRQESRHTSPDFARKKRSPIRRMLKIVLDAARIRALQQIGGFDEKPELPRRRVH